MKILTQISLLPLVYLKETIVTSAQWATSSSHSVMIATEEVHLGKTMNKIKMIFKMLSYGAMMSNLLFYHCNDPIRVHPRLCDIGEIISSDLCLHTVSNLSKEKKNVLFTLDVYSKEHNFGINSKLKLNPLSISFGGFPTSCKKLVSILEMLCIIYHCLCMMLQYVKRV